MLPSAAALEQHFDPDTASMLLALIERLTAHGVLGDKSRLGAVKP
jgi:hypothetical protein